MRSKAAFSLRWQPLSLPQTGAEKCHARMRRLASLGEKVARNRELWRKRENRKKAKTQRNTPVRVFNARYRLASALEIFFDQKLFVQPIAGHVNTQRNSLSLELRAIPSYRHAAAQPVECPRQALQLPKRSQRIFQIFERHIGEIIICIAGEKRTVNFPRL